jgi:hypothetical protein
MVLVFALIATDHAGSVLWPTSPVPQWLIDLDLWILAGRPTDPPPASQRDIAMHDSSVIARAPGQTLSVSAAVGYAPHRIAIRWRAELKPDDREMVLMAFDDDSEVATHRSDVSLTEPGQSSKTVNAHWELSTGQYTVSGCVYPRRACIYQTVIVKEYR